MLLPKAVPPRSGGRGHQDGSGTELRLPLEVLSMPQAIEQTEWGMLAATVQTWGQTR